MRRGALLILLGLSALAGAARAQEDLESILEGFEDSEPPPPSAAPAPPAAARRWDLSGALQLGGSHAYAHRKPPPGRPDYRGWPSLRAELSLQFDLKLGGSWQARVAGRGFRDYFYAIEGRETFPRGVLERHQRELEFQELWIRGSPRPDIDLQFGRQVLSWGRSDNLRVLDLLNPIDSREPGLVDVEDLKLPLTMTRLDWYRGAWSLTAVAIHESRFDTGPVPGSEFWPAGVPALPERRPSNGGRDTEYALRARGIFPGWDLSLHWARFFDDPVHVRERRPDPSADGEASVPAVSLESAHARLTLWGVSGQVARGNWLLKGELAYLRGLRFFEPRPRRRSRVDAMLGVEYSGFEDTMIALELVNRRLGGFDRRLETEPVFVRRDTLEASLLVTRDFLHDTLHATLVGLAFGSRARDGAILRAQLEYDLRDALAVTFGVVLFRKGDLPPFSFLHRHDRLFLRLKYSF
ncbi:MAG: hypothetical protein J4G09_04100 [Proteobacteria bacterium]|nr:hypothetical protein [Pseudomonadota bacterium]